MRSCWHCTVPAQSPHWDTRCLTLPPCCLRFALDQKMCTGTPPICGTGCTCPAETPLCDALVDRKCKVGGCRRRAGIAACSVGPHRCTGAVGRWIFERPWPRNALCILRNLKAPLSPRAGLLHHAGPLQPGLRLPGATVVRQRHLQARLRVHLQCQLRVSHQRPNLRLHGQQMQGLHGEQPAFRCAAKGCMLQLRGAALP